MPFPLFGTVISIFAEAVSRASESTAGPGGEPPPPAARELLALRRARERQEEFGPDPRFGLITSGRIREAERAANEELADLQQALTIEGMVAPVPGLSAPNPATPPLPPPATEEPGGDDTDSPEPGLQSPQEDEPVAFGIGDFGNILTGIGDILGGVGGRDAGPAVVINPGIAPPTLGGSLGPLLPSVVRGVGGVVAGGAAGAGITRLFSGGNGEMTALQRISANTGRRVSRKQVITAARVCGLDTAAQTFNSDVRLICEVVSKGMPRRSRGISGRDLSRCRSTIRKMTTMQKSLKALASGRR